MTKNNMCSTNNLSSDTQELHNISRMMLSFKRLLNFCRISEHRINIWAPLLTILTVTFLTVLYREAGLSDPWNISILTLGTVTTYLSYFLFLENIKNDLEKEIEVIEFDLKSKIYRDLRLLHPTCMVSEVGNLAVFGEVIHYQYTKFKNRLLYTTFITVFPFISTLLVYISSIFPYSTTN